jgi:hypothetical protein
MMKTCVTGAKENCSNGSPILRVFLVVLPLGFFGSPALRLVLY